MSPLISPAEFKMLGIPLVLFSILIPLVGIGVFSYIIKQRLAPMLVAADDERFDHPAERWKNVLSLWLYQSRQLRYKTAGLIHLFIFFGFLVLAIRTCSLVFVGIFDGFTVPGFGGTFGAIYNVAKDIAAIKSAPYPIKVPSKL